MALVNQVIQGDCLEVMREIPDKSIHACITSPPYYGLRDYGTASWEGGQPNCDHNPQQPDGGDRSNRTLPLGIGGLYKDTCGKCGAIRVDHQIGLEETPEAYVANLVAVFREVKRILKDDGTLWLNLGDSYNTQPAVNKKPSGFSQTRPSRQTGNGCQETVAIPKKVTGLKPKDLIGIPWMVAFALRADGWYLRSDIIWHKPNPMPESVTDRPTKSHEYLFLLTKSPNYFYDFNAISERTVEPYSEKRAMRPITSKGKEPTPSGNPNNLTYNKIRPSGMRNKRSVWKVNTKPYKEAHFATYPVELITPCVLAGCPVKGTIIDPFSGAATTGVAAITNDRNYIGIELNKTYVTMSKRRISEAQRPLLEAAI